MVDSGKVSQVLVGDEDIASPVDPRSVLVTAIEAAALWLGKQQWMQIEAARKEARQRFVASAGVATKTISQVVTKYNDQLTNAVHDVWNGHSSAIDLRRAHKAMLKDFAPKVYEEGLREGSVDELDDEDQAVMDEAVGDWLGAQFEHINSFAKDVETAKGDKDLRPAILDRVAMWVDSLRSLGDLGKAYALKNERGQWVLGATEKHCDTCLKLSNMKPHRLSWFTERGYIPRQNGSGTLECGGWLCDCEIQNKKGDRLL